MVFFMFVMVREVLSAERIAYGKFFSGNDAFRDIARLKEVNADALTLAANEEPRSKLRGMDRSFQSCVMPQNKILPKGMLTSIPGLG
jgi:hypothetical protein